MEFPFTVRSTGGNGSRHSSCRSNRFREKHRKGFRINCGKLLSGFITGKDLKKALWVQLGQIRTLGVGVTTRSKALGISQSEVEIRMYLGHDR